MLKKKTLKFDEIFNRINISPEVSDFFNASQEKSVDFLVSTFEFTSDVLAFSCG